MALRAEVPPRSLPESLRELTARAQNWVAKVALSNKS